MSLTNEENVFLTLSLLIGTISSEQYYENRFCTNLTVDLLLIIGDVVVKHSTSLILPALLTKKVVSYLVKILLEF